MFPASPTKKFCRNARKIILRGFYLILNERGGRKTITEAIFMINYRKPVKVRRVAAAGNSCLKHRHRGGTDMNKRVLTAAMIGTALAANLSAPALANDFRVTLPATGIDASNDGRIILVITLDDSKEPRFQVKLGADAPQVFGINVDGLKPSGSASIGRGVLGYPAEDLSKVPAGDYTVQAVLHKYTTYKLSTGHTVKLPAARGAC